MYSVTSALSTSLATGFIFEILRFGKKNPRRYCNIVRGSGLLPLRVTHKFWTNVLPAKLVPYFHICKYFQLFFYCYLFLTDWKAKTPPFNTVSFLPGVISVFGAVLSFVL